MSAKSPAEQRIDQLEELHYAEPMGCFDDEVRSLLATALRMAELSGAGCEVKIEPAPPSVRHFHRRPELVTVRVRHPEHPEIATDSGMLRTLPAAVAVAHNRALALLEASGLLPDEG